MTKKIMIVEDDDITIKYLENLFKDNGYETCVATDGTQALELLKNEKPDLITLDIQMPSEWGPRFYRKVSKDKELKKIPVIVISGLDGDHAVKDAVAFIRKPFDPDKLLGIVKSTIG
ncbi:MAG: response regulator [Desulfobacterales bacterium]|nr:response regulator [Desulfobacterales bacterium]